MEPLVKVKWWRGGRNAIAVTEVHFWQEQGPVTWQPPINAFRCQDCVRICVDLAGVERSQIELRVEPRRVILRGQRTPPEPEGQDKRALQVLALEIDYGPFLRELRLPAEVNVEEARAEQENGLLWICLPLKK